MARRNRLPGELAARGRPVPETPRAAVRQESRLAEEIERKLADWERAYSDPEDDSTVLALIADLRETLDR